MTPRQRHALLITLFLALLVRVLLVLSLDGKPFMDHPIVDSAAYDAWAQEIAEGDVWGDEVFYQDPLYPYWLGSVYSAVGRNLLVARLAQCFFATLGLWLLFEGVRRKFDYPTALAALILGGFYQTAVFYDGMLLKDFLGVIAVEAAIFFWSLEQKWKWLAFGAVLGLGTLVRGNMLLVSLVAAGLLAWRREWKPVGMVIAGTALAILPVTVRNAAVAGDFVLTTAQAGPNLYTGNNPENTTGRYRPPSFVEAASPIYEAEGFRQEAEKLLGRPLKPSEVDAYWRRRALSYIGSNFGTFLGVTAKRVLMLINGREIPDDHDQYFMKRFSWVLNVPMFTLGLFMMPLAAAGMVLAWQDRKKHALLYLMLGAYAFSIIFFFIFARYRLPIVPILIVFAAYGAVTAWRKAEGNWRRIPRGAAIVFGCALVIANAPLPESIGGHTDFRVAHRNLGLYYFNLEHYAEAAEEFDEAARLNPAYLSSPQFLQLHGLALDFTGSNRALEKYIRWTKVDPKSADACTHAAGFYTARGMHDQAIVWYTRAVRAAPGDASYATLLVTAYMNAGQYDQALQLLNGLPPESLPPAYLPRTRARIFEKTGMWPEALKAAEAWRTAAPDDPDAQRVKAAAEARIREAKDRKP